MATKFPLGQVVATRNAAETLSHEEIAQALARHGAADWGDVDEHDRQENE